MFPDTTTGGIALSVCNFKDLIWDKESTESTVTISGDLRTGSEDCFDCAEARRFEFDSVTIGEMIGRSKKYNNN